MGATKAHFFFKMFVVLLFSLSPTACIRQDVNLTASKAVSTETQPYTTRPIVTPILARTVVPEQSSPTPTRERAHKSSPTPTPMIDATFQTWHATAISVKETDYAVREQARFDRATQIAQFPLPCEDNLIGSKAISPDGKWFAAGCGNKEDTTLVVQGAQGAKWTLKFEDFLSLDSPEGMWGSLYPVFWSPDGRFLYFSPDLAYDGGGNQCFTFGSHYGLFRLSLATGAWVALVPLREAFPGYQVQFTPSGRYFAINKNGLTVTDVETFESSRIVLDDQLTGIVWSPDGNSLAYSTASCGEEFVESSSVYKWDLHTITHQRIFSVDGILLRPVGWRDDSKIGIDGEKFVCNVRGCNPFYTHYEYSLTQGGIIFEGTATPKPR